MLLMTLVYLREYKTYYHIAYSYKTHETICLRNIRWVENTLIKHLDFALPDKKNLIKKGHDAMVLDATEVMIDRAKKTKAFLLWESGLYNKQLKSMS